MPTDSLLAQALIDSVSRAVSSSQIQSLATIIALFLVCAVKFILYFRKG